MGGGDSKVCRDGYTLVGECSTSPGATGGSTCVKGSGKTTMRPTHGPTTSPEPFTMLFPHVVTIGGARAGVDCVFPFTYSGVVYTSCTIVENENVEWCATKVDKYMDYVDD